MKIMTAILTVIIGVANFQVQAGQVGASVITPPDRLNDTQLPQQKPACKYDEKRVSRDHGADLPPRCNFTCTKPNEKVKVRAFCDGTLEKQSSGNIKLGESVTCPKIDSCVSAALKSRPDLDLKWVQLPISDQGASQAQ